MMNAYYFDMDGVLANFHKEPYKYANAISREWIANLDPFMHNVNVVRELIAQGNKVYILSKCASEQAKLGKIDWLAHYIPEMRAENIIILVGSGKKVDYIKEDGVLVDDDEKNLKPWAKAGHAVYHVAVKGADIVL